MADDCKEAFWRNKQPQKIPAYPDFCRSVKTNSGEKAKCNHDVVVLRDDAYFGAANLWRNKPTAARTKPDGNGLAPTTPRLPPRPDPLARLEQ
jgi:hypothetical protein